jgi:putative hydrolase of the HAD superfamily
MNHEKNLFFDLDHTLWDFETNSKNALRIIYNEFQLNEYVKHFEHFYKVYKKVNAEMWKLYGNGKITKNELRIIRFKKTLEKFNQNDPTLTNQLANSYLEISPKQTQLFPSTLETLEELKKLNYKLHIITNGFKEVQFIKLENSNLLHFFDVIICSEMVGFNKPNPKIFYHAMKEAKANPTKSIMIGDDPRVDILGAISAGMDAILFDPKNEYQKMKHTKIGELSELPLIIAMKG